MYAKRLISVVLLAVVFLAVAKAAMAQGVACTGDPSINDRLARLEAQVGDLTNRMGRVERIVTGLADATGNLYQTVASRGPAETPYRMVSLQRRTPSGGTVANWHVGQQRNRPGRVPLLWCSLGQAGFGRRRLCGGRQRAWRGTP